MAHASCSDWWGLGLIPAACYQIILPEPGTSSMQRQGSTNRTAVPDGVEPHQGMNLSPANHLARASGLPTQREDEGFSFQEGKKNKLWLLLAFIFQTRLLLRH